MLSPPKSFPATPLQYVSWIAGSTTRSFRPSLSRTTYLIRLSRVPNAQGFDLRWFTPFTEVALCGHATLASAFVLFNCQNWPAECIRFQTRWSGTLVVTRRDDLLEMDFPAIAAHNITPPAGLEDALGVRPQETLGSAEDLLVVLDTDFTVREVQPDFLALARIECRGIIITARGERCDFVSRFFAPRLGVPEDPVTGSSHSVLAPYWAEKLGKNNLHAFQVSKRGGELFCTHAGRRVKISGRTALYMKGLIMI